MENIINVNIGGVSFALNKEAYSKLESYLNELSNHYKSSVYGEEIMADIESRIAELLLEKYKKEDVVTQERVDELIEIMGAPSDYYFSDNEEDNENNNQYESGSQRGGNNSDNTQSKKEEEFKGYNPNINEREVNKKLFRDVNNKYIGGVCSGLSHYLSIDSLFVRLIFLGCLLLSGSYFKHLSGFVFLVYIILWVVVPGAKTYTQKCAMYGKDPGLKGAEESAPNGYVFMEERSTFEKVVRVVIGIILLAIGASILFIGGTATLADHSKWFNFREFFNLESLLLPGIFLTIIWLVSAIFFIYEGVKFIGLFKTPSWHPGIILFIIWIVSIVLFFVTLFYSAGKSFNERVFVDLRSIIENAGEDDDSVVEVIVDTLGSADSEIIVADSTGTVSIGTTGEDVAGAEDKNAKRERITADSTIVIDKTKANIKTDTNTTTHN